MSDGVPEGVLSMRVASLMPQEDGLFQVRLFQDQRMVHISSWESRDQAQRLVDSWAQRAEIPEIP